MSQECNQLAVTEETPCGVQIAFQGWTGINMACRAASLGEVGEPGRLRRERER